jgi:hypothetical protein
MLGSTRLPDQDQFVCNPACFGEKARTLGRPEVIVEGAAEDPLEGAFRERQG